MIPGLLINLCMYYCVAQTIAKYSEPGATDGNVIARAIHSGPLSSLPTNCDQEYHWLQFTMHASLYMNGLQVLMNILQAYMPCGGVLVAIVLFIEVCLCFVMTYISINGLILTAFKFDLKQIEQCEDLHNWAWWIYCGFQLITLISLVGVAIVMGAMWAKGREPQVAVEETKYEKMPEEAATA